MFRVVIVVNIYSSLYNKVFKRGHFFMMFLQNQIATVSKPAGTQAFLTATSLGTYCSAHRRLPWSDNSLNMFWHSCYRSCSRSLILLPAACMQLRGRWVPRISIPRLHSFKEHLICRVRSLIWIAFGMLLECLAILSSAAIQ